MSEKTTDERIVEYIWLHAYEPSEKIQAGILKEFGVTKSLEWISKEKQEYLASDGSSIEENNLKEHFADEEAVRRVAKSFPSVTEKQIIELVRLKTTTRLGYRKIGQRLNPAVGKDTVMHIWKTYQAMSKPPKPSKLAEAKEEVERLRALVAEKEQLKNLQKEKEELIRKNVLLSLETQRDDLILHLTKREGARVDPETNQSFIQYCQSKHRSPKEALEIMDITASNLIEDFDHFYEVWAEDGFSGIECLIRQIWLEIKIFLQKYQRIQNKKF